jgi:hypothetical protein
MFGFFSCITPSSILSNIKFFGSKILILVDGQAPLVFDRFGRARHLEGSQSQAEDEERRGGFHFRLFWC